MKFILSDWTDWDEAAFQLGVFFGLWPTSDEMRDHKHIFWSNNPIGEHLNVILESLVSMDLLEKRDEDDIQYRTKQI